MEKDAYYYLLALVPLLHLIRLYRASFVRRTHAHGLRLPPGPWQLPVIGSLHHLFGALPHRALRDLSRRHGPLMLLKFGENPVIIASTAEAAKEIMKTHDTIFCTRPMSSSVKVINELGRGIAFAPYGDHWRQMRKICFLELLSAKRVSSFQPVRGEEAARLISSISSASKSEQVVNLSKMLAMYVTDTTVHAIMGGRFREQDALLRYVDEAVRLVGGFSLPDLFPSSRLALALGSSTLRKAEVFRDSLMAFMDRVIGDHLEKKPSNEEVYEEDLIDVLLRIRGEDELQFPLTMSNINAVVFDLFAGGSETATTTLQWAMAELMRNPSVMSRAQAEVRAAFMGQMKVSEELLGELSYLQCVIKETLRLHTPGPLLMPRECQEHCEILGYDVPKGTTVLVNAWAISRDPGCWDEPEAFVPERFVASVRDYKGNNFEFIPFGAGRRICPGMLFGIANIELALASLLFYFDWSLPDGVLPSKLDMTEAFGVTARKKVDLLLRPTIHVQLPC
ncbi:desmethyl-deoxy-podophyllotoxin synthase-like [Hordeum vulgare subsp. vulgare]|uniref:desmethyl-deoxy-podophyllotoxin synthase-like n=1 Tax=Hordeum vulgare subsp. vulgare TaxID=112509 RepID=UPI001D1A4409|nr:desmethyl-deoxy-podophyllotoxin synthase-like [Hordeum vulgare subsp. vulgare]